MNKSNYTLIQTVGNLSTDVKNFSNEGKKRFSTVNLIVNISDTEKQYFKVKAFENLSDTLSNMQKGALVNVKGYLSIEKYTNKENVEKQSLVITLKDIKPIAKKETE